jgi:hypothetical protein
MQAYHSSRRTNQLLFMFLCKRTTNQVPLYLNNLAIESLRAWFTSTARFVGPTNQSRPYYSIRFPDFRPKLLKFSVAVTSRRWQFFLRIRDGNGCKPAGFSLPKPMPINIRSAR